MKLNTHNNNNVEFNFIKFKHAYSQLTIGTLFISKHLCHVLSCSTYLHDISQLIKTWMFCMRTLKKSFISLIFNPFFYSKPTTRCNPATFSKKKKENGSLVSLSYSTSVGKQRFFVFILDNFK